MNKQICVSHFLFLCAYLLCMADAVVLGLSTFSHMNHASLIGWGMRGVAAAFILLKLFLDSRYTLGALIYSVCAGVLLLVSFALSRYNHIFYLLLIVLGARNIRVCMVVKTDMIVRCALVLIIVVCALMGVIDNRATYRTGSTDVRYSLGFYHPNTLASMALLLVMQEAWLSRRRFSILYMLFVWAVSAGIYLITLNRTSVLLMAVFPLMLLAVTGKKPKKTVSLRLYWAALVLFPLVVIFCYAAMEMSGSGPFMLIDRLMSKRFTNCRRLFEHYGISMLGQYVDLSSGDLGRIFGIYVTLLDVAYLRTLLQAGPLVLVLMGWMHICAVQDAKACGDRHTILMMCVFVLFGIGESLYNNVYMNFSLLFGARAVYASLERGRNSWREEKDARALRLEHGQETEK